MAAIVNAKTVIQSTGRIEELIGRPRRIESKICRFNERCYNFSATGLRASVLGAGYDLVPTRTIKHLWRGIYIDANGNLIDRRQSILSAQDN
jgi:hypothetical protein